MDGQYVNEPFTRAIVDNFSYGGDDTSIFHLPISWDSAHFLNLAVTDVRDGKKGFPETVARHFSTFIERCNEFSHLFGRGKNNAVLKAVARKNKLELHIPLVYAMQRSVSTYLN